MADEEKVEGAEGEGDAKKKPNLKSLILIGSWVVVQIAVVAVVLIVARMGAQGPAPAQASQKNDDAPTVELPVNLASPDAKITAMNAKSGQVNYWQLRVYLRVPADQEKYVRERIESNQEYIKQEIITLVADADPVQLETEADHATLKRQIRFALHKVLGKGIINDVIISECINQRMQ